MSEQNEKKYPVTLEHENGQKVKVRNEVQESAFLKAGFTEEKKK